MRRWGVFVSLFYALVVLCLLVPLTFWLAGDANPSSPEFLSEALKLYREAWVWIVGAILVACQSILLFVSVDTRWKRMRPRAHVALTCAVSALLFASLTLGVISSITVAAPKGSALASVSDHFWMLSAISGGFWVLWAVIFGIYRRGSSDLVNRLVGWLLKGSVLELLIAVPCHVIVRRRNECCAPIITGAGIATGIAIMLLSFGPSVLFLVSKRMEHYRKHPDPAL